MPVCAVDFSSFRKEYCRGLKRIAEVQPGSLGFPLNMGRCGARFGSTYTEIWEDVKQNMACVCLCFPLAVSDRVRSD